MGELHVVRADSKHWRLSWQRSERATSDAALSDVDAMARGASAKVAVNAGFFDEGGRPLGLRVSEGVVKNKLRKADWGVFFVRDGTIRQVHTSEADASRGADFAIQCGPRLVQDGKPFHLKTGRHRRTIIGSDPSGRVYLAVTLGFVDLNDLAQALARPVAQGGLGLRYALNLDGGPSTAMFVDGGKGRWNVPGGSGVAGAVTLVPVAP